MPRRSSCLLAALAMTTLTAMVPVAWAQGKKPQSASAARKEAKRLFDRGRIAFRAKRYEEAILRWQESYALSNEPLILWNIANAFEELGQPAEALGYLHEWSPHAKESEKEELEARIARLEKQVEALPPDPAPTDPKPTGPDIEITDPEPEQDPGPPAMEIAGWTMVGLGGAAVVTGVVLDVVAHTSRPDEEPLCQNLDGDNLCLAAGRDDINTSNTLALAGDITWIAGSVVAATGLTLALVSVLGTSEQAGDEAKADVSLTPRLGLTPGGLWHVGLGVDGSF